MSCVHECIHIDFDIACKLMPMTKTLKLRVCVSVCACVDVCMRTYICTSQTTMFKVRISNDLGPACYTVLLDLGGT